MADKQTPRDDVEAEYQRSCIFIDQSWIQEWEEGKFALTDEVKRELKQQSNKLKSLMFAFPPNCLVQPTKPLKIPQMGTIGLVCGHSEEDNGSLLVKQDPSSEIVANCSPRDLAVVGYYAGLTPEALAIFF